MTGVPAQQLNEQQDALCELGILDVLVIAPAGCGKTQALAARAASLVKKGCVPAPRKVLAVTFSNKARDNLATRMRREMGSRWREDVTVQNFHGLATRIILAHGNKVGVKPNIRLPERGWRSKTLRELGISWKESPSVDEALREAKNGPFDDDKVLHALETSGSEEALSFEKRLREEGRLDYDDVIRHAARALSLPPIAALYKAHFAAVLVDEVQDLTLSQLSMVQAIGEGNTTYAGDPAQGIYSFAGAQPNEVFQTIRLASPKVVEFSASYRSSPAVLLAVNRLAKEMEATELTCANPSAFRDDGHVLVMRNESLDKEAEDLVPHLEQLVRKNPTISVGVIARRGSRLSRLKEEAARRGLGFEDWSAPTHVPRLVELLNRFAVESAANQEDAEQQFECLEALCRAQIDPTDMQLLDELVSACEELRGLVGDGLSLTGAVDSCRKAKVADAPVTPGLHLLNGHLGKGQEFDWVVVLGLEEGQIPDFRAPEREGGEEEEVRVLHVMISRAKYGLILTCCSSHGHRQVAESHLLAVLEDATTGDIDSQWEEICNRDLEAGLGLIGNSELINHP